MHGGKVAAPSPLSDSNSVRFITMTGGSEPSPLFGCGDHHATRWQTNSHILYHADLPEGDTSAFDFYLRWLC